MHLNQRNKRSWGEGWGEGRRGGGVWEAVDWLIFVASDPTESIIGRRRRPNELK